MSLSPSLIDEIEDALAAKSDEKRAVALWRITDLFIAGADTFSDDHVTLFDDVMERLAATIEKNARAKLSSRIARIANAPPGLVRDLARDHDIRVAQPVLRHSPRLDDRWLSETASTHSQQHLLAISQRGALSEAITEVLVERGDREVVRSVAQNSGARFSSAAFRTLVERSVGDEVSRLAAWATSSTAALNAASLAFDGLLNPLSLRTNCSAAACTSASVAGGAKL